MNRYEMYRQTNLTNNQKGTYSHGLRSGTVLSSTANPGDRKSESDVIVPVHASRPSAHRLDSELWRLVLTDKLTGLCNQHGFIALAEHEWRSARRTKREMVFVGLELAHSEERHNGAADGRAGLALIRAARILEKSFRRSDVLCRWDADEFRVLAVDGEGLDEAMVRSRIECHSRIEGAPAARAPLVFRGRLARIRPQAADTFAAVLARLDQEFDEFKLPWNETAGRRPIAAAADAA
jgi:diguanylate cyclase (GGDEF)-like protein